VDSRPLNDTNCCDVPSIEVIMSTPGTPWSAERAVDPDRLRAAREELLSRGLLASPTAHVGVREVIERSWRRCVGQAVPIRPREVPYADASALQSILHDASAPVLERLGEHLTDVPVAMFVSNERGQIILRKANEAHQRALLDRACAAEGFDFSETSIGTNGLGTVIEERRPVLVHGAEHYNELLEQVTCAATPIFEPFTQRILGSFSLACGIDDANPLMYGMTTDVGRQIEANLTSMLGAHEQALIRAYLMADQSDREPVIVLTERTVFANTAGVPHLDSQSHAVLWAHLQDAPRARGPVRTRVPLGGASHDAVVEQLDSGRHSAYCIRLVPGPAAAPRERAPAGGARRAVRASDPRALLHPVAEVSDQLRAAARHGRCLAVDGDQGTGKLRAAVAMLTSGGASPPLVLDVSAFRSGQGPEWLGWVVDALQAGRGVVLRHLQDLSAVDLNRVKAIAETARSGAGAAGGPAAAPTVRLAVTVDLAEAPAHVQRLVGEVATTVRLPALVEMRPQIPQLVADALAELPGEAAGTRLSSDALQALMRAPWPGNIAELRAAVTSLAQRLPGRTVRGVDLPAHLHRVAVRRQLSLMEVAESEAITAALQRCGGNRREAAEALGIGRTTLWRKMQRLGIDT
jgi:transcriptional regulator of acetoin/glycerol metabolism